MEQELFTEFNFEGIKNSTPIECNSELLFNYLVSLEWNAAIESYFQPLMDVTVIYKGFEYGAHIDLWTEGKEGTVSLIHIPDEQTMDLYRNHPMLLARLKHSCQSFNSNFIVLEEAQITKQSFTYNLKQLWPYAGREIRLGHKLLINRFFTLERKPNVGKLKSFLMQHGFEAEYVYSFIFHKVVLADIGYFPITDDTHILAGTFRITLEYVKSPVLQT
jgi:hypothetical protein